MTFSILPKCQGLVTEICVQILLRISNTFLFLDGRSCHPSLKSGASLQFNLSKFQLDYYPYHLATGDRNHWLRYQDGPANQWLYKGLQDLRSKIFEYVGVSGNAEKQKVTRSQAMGTPQETAVGLSPFNLYFFCGGTEKNKNGGNFKERRIGAKKGNDLKQL